jgi:hypothetical protein
VALSVAMETMSNLQFLEWVWQTSNQSNNQDSYSLQSVAIYMVLWTEDHAPQKWGKK